MMDLLCLHSHLLGNRLDFGVFSQHLGLIDRVKNRPSMFIAPTGHLFDPERPGSGGRSLRSATSPMRPASWLRGVKRQA